MNAPLPIPTERLIEALASHGYAQVEDFLPADLVATLAEEAMAMHDHGQLRKASTGKQPTHDSQSIRGDYTSWLSHGSASPAQQCYLDAMRSLQVALNRSLFLGLHEFETHFALYPPGSGYAKHLDQLRDTQQRQVSSVLYLNQHWQNSDDGELRLYLDGGEPLDIQPCGGRLVLFLSGRFWHEVLPARRQRLSLTGWFRTRSEHPL